MIEALLSHDFAASSRISTWVESLLETETLDLKTEREDDVLSAHVGGRIDGSNAGRFEEMLRTAIEESDRAVIMDFEQLLYISSAGLRAVLFTAKSLWKQGTTFALCSLSEQTRAVFKSSGFDRMVRIHASRREALDSLDE